MTAQSIASLESSLHEYIARGQMAGVVALISRPGQPVRKLTIGRRDVERDLPIAHDTIFRIASATKPITTVAALALLRLCGY
jgi:CubicO group peptidase (beta-lactamase class C family)